MVQPAPISGTVPPTTALAALQTALDAMLVVLNSIPLYPVEKANVHNVAVPANTNILAPPLTPINTPCIFRIMVAFDKAGVFSATITRGPNTQTVALNGSANLAADAVHMFDMLVHASDIVNYRYSFAATLKVLRIQEISLGV